MKFGIYGNTGKKDISVVLNKITSYLEKKGQKYFIESSLSRFIKNKTPMSQICKISEIIKKCDIIISLGGDGTFLRSARKTGKAEIPILGINLGNLGFMAEISPEQAEEFLGKVIDGKYKVYDLCVISGICERQKIFGMNEIVIDKCNSIKMIDIEIKYKKESVVKFVADGVIVSTPTGSTGYSLSAGGPIISPYSKVFIITPICPHTLNFRPIIVPDDGEIVISTTKKGKVRFTSDGFTSTIHSSPAVFKIKKADYNIKIVKDLDKTYFQTLNTKLLWGADSRKF
ncbi:NAD kinase [bacterium]|nr:MAG: NAD kinase [bacterium]